MDENNDFGALDQLTDAALAEVIREGELEIQAQLQTSLAADSRALTISGSCLTAATALLGAAAALSKSEPPDYPLMLVAIFLAVALLLAAGLAIHSARPIEFGFPGNDPANWLPDGWRRCTGRGYGLKRARIEQAMTLQENIVKNRRSTSRNASLVQAALRVAYGATLAAAGATIAIVATRAC